MEALNRRKVRYWCFRFKTECLGGDLATDSPIGLRDHFENLEWFDSWLNFGITWDVRDDNPLILSKLKQSHEEIWDDVLKLETKELPNLDLVEIPNTTFDEIPNPKTKKIINSKK